MGKRTIRCQDGASWTSWQKNDEFETSRSASFAASHRDVACCQPHVRTVGTQQLALGSLLSCRHRSMMESTGAKSVHSRTAVSLLSGATEAIFALGLEEQLVGRSHECDYPAEAVAKLPP